MGGDVFRALLGTRSFYVSLAAVGLLLVAGLFYPGWWIFALLILFLGVRHPPPLNDISGLKPSRQLVGLLAAGILVTGFVLVPLSTPSGSFTLENAQVLPGLPPPANNTTVRISFDLVNQDLVGHGFTLGTNLTVFVEDSSNNLVQLRGSALANYTRNLTWSLELTNGTTYGKTGTAAFSLPGATYLSVPATGEAGARFALVLTVFDPQPSML
ncbi:membrane protein, partial [mine drainage metagenome]